MIYQRTFCTKKLYQVQTPSHFCWNQAEEEESWCFEKKKCFFDGQILRFEKLRSEMNNCKKSGVLWCNLFKIEVPTEKDQLCILAKPFLSPGAGLESRSGGRGSTCRQRRLVGLGFAVADMASFETKNMENRLEQCFFFCFSGCKTRYFYYVHVVVGLFLGTQQWTWATSFCFEPKNSWELTIWAVIPGECPWILQRVEEGIEGWPPLDLIQVRSSWFF